MRPNALQGIIWKVTPYIFLNRLERHIEVNNKNSPDDPEIWVELEDFPIYKLSNFGRLIQIKNEAPLRTSFTGHGHAKVALTCDGNRYTRSVSKLVAKHFVEKPDDKCDTVIIKNRHLEDCAAYNLEWRPNWFAWEYANQFNRMVPIAFQDRFVVNLSLDVRYPNIVETAINEGLLMRDIYRSILNGTPVYPNYHFYRFL
jgi:hypothetical protein